MKHIEKKILMLLSVVVLAAGCIKEDLDDCWNVSLYFQYLADGDKDVLAQYVDKVYLFVYNEADELVAKESYNQDELINFQATPHFRLMPGRYRTVVVGNAYDQTVVVNEASGDYDHIYIQHPNWGTDEVVEGHDHNYIGDAYFEIGADKLVRDTVTMESAHVNVEVEIKGAYMGTKADNGGYTLVFENSNAQTSFKNEVNPGAQGNCYPELFYDEATGFDEATGLLKTQDLALFRMDGDGCCNHLMKLMDAEGKVVAEKDIDEYIEENKIDITKAEVTLRIGIEFTQLGPVQIHIPDWEIVDVTPEL